MTPSTPLANRRCTSRSLFKQNRLIELLIISSSFPYAKRFFFPCTTAIGFSSSPFPFVICEQSTFGLVVGVVVVTIDDELDDGVVTVEVVEVRCNCWLVFELIDRFDCRLVANNRFV